MFPVVARVLLAFCRLPLIGGCATVTLTENPYLKNVLTGVEVVWGGATAVQKFEGRAVIIKLLVMCLSL